MKIVRADHLGMCFGVRDAISLALQETKRESLTVLGELVHNQSVLDHLSENGVKMATSPDQIGTRTVMITAHGASDVAISRLEQQGKRVLEATCPLVAYAHRSIQKLAAENYYPIIIGKRGHVEVRGLTEDLREYTLVLNDEDLDRIPPRPKIGVASQTTQPFELVSRFVGEIKRRFPSSEVKFVDTVCQPTKQRQNAAIELAKTCDTIVVIGGAHSNNTRQLVETCRSYCMNVHHVEKADQLQVEWFETSETVGITAGTSTPDSDIQKVEEWLMRIATCDAVLNPLTNY